MIGGRGGQRRKTVNRPTLSTSPQAGFTLLEVLIALVIVMVALGGLLDGGVLGLRSAHASQKHEQAASLARSYLAEQSVALQPGERSGDAGDGFVWRVAIRPISAVRVVPLGAPPGLAAQAPVVTLYGVTVQVSWKDGAGGGVEQIESRRLTTRYAEN